MRTEYFWPSVRRDLERTERSRTLHPRKKKNSNIISKQKTKAIQKKNPRKTIKPQYPCAKLSTINTIYITMYIFTIPELILKLIYKLGTD